MKHPEQDQLATQSDNGVESTWRVMFGLLVIWLVLVLIFKANQLSEGGITVRRDLLATPSSVERLSVRDHRLRLWLPAEIGSRPVSPRQALADLARRLDMTFNPADLARLAETPAAVVSAEGPAVELMHRLVNNPSLGLLLRGERLRLIDQQLEIAPNGGFLWRASLPLDQSPVTILPALGLPWISLQLIHPEEVQLESWRGSQWIGSLRLRLDEQGRGELEMAGNERVGFKLERHQSPAQPNLSAHYTLELTSRHGGRGIEQEN